MFLQIKLVYLSGKGDENGDDNLLRLQDDFPKSHEEVLIQGNLSSSSW